MAEETCDMGPPPLSEGATAMTEPACERPPEESLNPQEPEEAGPSAPLKEKKPRHRSHSRRKKRHSHSKHRKSFITYFPRVLKHIHSGLSLSRSTLSILDSFVKDMFERIASEAGRLARQNERSIINSREIQTAVRLLLPGEIGKHAVYEATRAISRLHHHQ